MAVGVDFRWRPLWRPLEDHIDDLAVQPADAVLNAGKRPIEALADLINSRNSKSGHGFRDNSRGQFLNERDSTRATTFGD
jgi:hypothetical protein